MTSNDTSDGLYAKQYVVGTGSNGTKTVQVPIVTLCTAKHMVLLVSGVEVFGFAVDASNGADTSDAFRGKTHAFGAFGAFNAVNAVNAVNAASVNSFGAFGAAANKIPMCRRLERWLMLYKRGENCSCVGNTEQHR